MKLIEMMNKKKREPDEHEETSKPKTLKVQKIREK
jgi:hypothetical protein